MTGQTEVATERVIDDIPTLKALADPIRLSLLDYTMGKHDQTFTAKDLAAHIGVLPTNIYYHLNMLERHGLLRVRETRVVNGIIEKHYGAGQRSLAYHRRSQESPDGIREVVSSKIVQAKEEIDAGLAMGVMTASREAPEQERMMVSTRIVSIPEDQVDRYRQDLLALLERYKDATKPGIQYKILLAMYPG
jgi:DNA-binding transcriptional ArsR family regulator